MKQRSSAECARDAANLCLCVLQSVVMVDDQSHRLKLLAQATLADAVLVDAFDDRSAFGALVEFLLLV